ncbi:deaminase [Streptomonospora salina]|uniref:tRNA(Arg) A34 adenosine deaminase TadA n=1 Tax=Streptomonospora salina TaxID=104205 RepID=A0A841E6D6_9ACTN|nr:nucleoside deaminase [Streptomonospora salina]MBB5998362.1 tRNA(Arg) A34 adenosine deaminase TadA [Streptomonospora salina]
MGLTVSALRALMERAVDACIAHVDGGGLPFVGVVADETGAISAFGVNKVSETGDQSAHAEIVAMRDATVSHRLKNLAGTSLLATGEPCGLCYRYAIERGVDAVYIALGRDAVAERGFDYRASYPAMGISDDELDGFVHRIPVERGTEPFARYLWSETNPGTNTHPSKGTP